MFEWIAGLTGELVTAFIDLVGAGPPVDPERWCVAGGWVAAAIGGVPARIQPLRWDPPPPGSLLEDALAAGQAAGRDEWLEMLRDRLTELTLEGLAEPFLIQGLTGYVTSQYQHQADHAVLSDNRLRAASLYRQIAESPPLLAEFRAEQDRGRPDRHALSDEDYVDRLRRFADQTPEPETPDDAVTRWTVNDAWRTDVDAIFPPGVFDHWWLLHVRGHHPN